MCNEYPHGGRPVSTTDYRGTVTFLSLFTSHTIQYLASCPPVCCCPFIHHCFCLHSGPAENQVGKPHPQFGRASSCRYYSTIGVGSAGVTSGKIIKCPLNEPVAPGSTSTIYYHFFWPINHFIYTIFTSLSFDCGDNRDDRTSWS